MKQNALIYARALAVLALTVTILAASGAEAKNRIKGEYANTASPLYRVGDLNTELSRLCRKGQFKQRKMLRLSIGFIGKKGQGVTGIAQKGWNLYDPLGVAEDRRTYHFFNQGYSNCRVYEAETPRAPQPAQ